MLNLIIIEGIKIEVIQFHIMQLLLTVLNKNKWILDENKRKLSHWYKYLFKRYPLHHKNILVACITDLYISPLSIGRSSVLYCTVREDTCI